MIKQYKKVYLKFEQYLKHFQKCLENCISQINFSPQISIFLVFFFNSTIKTIGFVEIKIVSVQDL